MTKGTVFLSETVEEDGSSTWAGYWEGSEPGPGGDPSEPAGMLARAPSGLRLDELVAWARERAGRVVVGTADGRHLWAGSDPRPSDIDEDFVPGS